MFYSILHRLHDYVYLGKCRNVRCRWCAVYWWDLKLFPQWNRSTSSGSSQCTPVPATNTLPDRQHQALPLDPLNPFLSFRSSSLTEMAFPEATRWDHREDLPRPVCYNRSLTLSQLVIREYCIEDMELEKSFISQLASSHFGLIFLFIFIKSDLEPFVLCFSIYFPGFSEAAESTLYT